MPYHSVVRFSFDWQSVQPGSMKHKIPSPAGALASIDLDLVNNTWFARSQWQAIRTKFRCVTGKFAVRNIDIDIYGLSDQPEMILGAYNSKDPAPREGRIWRGQHPWNEHARGALRSYWYRTLDPASLSGYDRAVEMLDIACTDPRLKGKLASELGALANPMILLPLGAIMVVFFGAEFLGYAAFINAIRVLLGLGQLHGDYCFFEPRIRQLHRYLTGTCTEKELYDGAEIMQEIIVQVVQDIACQLGIGAAQKAAASAWAKFAKLLDIDVEAWKKAAREKLAEKKHQANVYAASKHGYDAEDLLQPAHDVNLGGGESKTYKQISARHNEVLVLREPSARRLDLLRSKVWIGGKMTWLKAKSKLGWGGLVCLKATDVGLSLERTAKGYDLGHLKGLNAEIDAMIATGKYKDMPMYEFPKDGRTIEGIDYSQITIIKKNPPKQAHDRYLELEGQYLVRIDADRYMVVDKVRGPYTEDVDIATRDRAGQNKAGAHLPEGRPNKRYQEDDMQLEDEINREMIRNGAPGADSLYSWALHGGGGASPRHVRIAKERGEKHWSPLLDKKHPELGFQKERLVIFLPVKKGRNGQVTSEMFTFKSWEDFETFSHKNGLEFPYRDKSYAKL
jgi:hypothetical protein